MPEMVAKVAQEYPVGTKRSIGDRFHVEPAHEKRLVSIGRVAYPEGGAPPAAQARAMTAATPPSYQTRALAASPAPKGPKKTRRRDSLLAKAP